MNKLETIINYKMRGESIDSIISNEEFKDEKEILNEIKTIPSNDISKQILNKIQENSGDSSFFYTEAEKIEVTCASLNYVIENTNNEEEFKFSFTKLSLMENETRIKIIITPEELKSKYKTLAGYEGIKLLSQQQIENGDWI